MVFVKFLRWAASQLGVVQLDDPAQWLKRLFLFPSADELAAARLPEGQIPNPLDWLAEALGVTDKRHIRQWILRLFIIAPGQSPREEVSFWSVFFRKAAHVFGMLFSSIGMMVTAAMFVINWIWQGLLSLLPKVNHEAVGHHLESFLETAWFHKPVLFWILVISSTFFSWLLITTPFTWSGQLLFAIAIWGTAMFVRRIPGNLPTLILIALSVMASCRYGWWRVTQTVSVNSGRETFFAISLLAAELYTWIVLLLGYVQTAWPLKRHVLSLPLDRLLWPSVDVFIPTYNEPLSVVKPTVLAVKGMDWPSDKINIYILDDGRREEFRHFARQAGVGYIVRPDNHHAKAGNLNHALKQTYGEYVAIFDCDHLPTRSFLQATMGWFIKDKQCAMVQTPHHFFSPDPFERNLGTFRKVPSEGSLFYGVIQDGNDFWNASFFCGSCAVLRRGPLEEVGGIAVETVTEDAHTALKLHRKGYTTAYINIPQAAGLATESLSGHIGQRIRWARGMAQIFRIDNPFLGKGLSLFQRICYSNAMLHFFYGIPRLIFLTAPLSYLYFQDHIISASAVMIVLYVLPHILQANLANAHIQGAYRHSFWAEVYESALAWYITVPTVVAMFNPGAGKFNVTAKGGLIERTYFDWTISTPYILLIVLNFAGLCMGVMRLFFWNTFETGTVMLNLIWTSYSLLILGVAIGVATETRQVRASHRVSARLPVALQFQDGNSVMCTTEDYSMTGLGLLLKSAQDVAQGQPLWVSLWLDEVEFTFPARVIISHGNKLGIHFDNLNLEQESNLVQCTFARADAWTDWTDEHDADHPMRNLKEIALLGIKGYLSLWRLVGAKHKLRDSFRRYLSVLN